MDDARDTYWRQGAQLVETALAKAKRGDHADAPFPLDDAQAKLWHRAQTEAYAYALEMMAPPSDDTTDDLLRRCNETVAKRLAPAAEAPAPRDLADDVDALDTAAVRLHCSPLMDMWIGDWTNVESVSVVSDRSTLAKTPGGSSVEGDATVVRTSGGEATLRVLVSFVDTGDDHDVPAIDLAPGR